MALVKTITVNREKREITITIPMEPDGTRSKGGVGPMFLLATTRGNQETTQTIELDGQQRSVFANINIGAYADPKKG